MSLSTSSNSSCDLPHSECLISRRSTSMSTALFISYIPLLPLFIFVLYVGYQRWRKQRSVATAATTSHSDIFTFNMVVLELCALLGMSIFCIGAYTDRDSLRFSGLAIFSIILPGETLFHLLTCVDRYLAVVHPVTYLGLKQSGGVRIRNISVGCVWFVCFGTMGLSELGDLSNIILNFIFMVFSLIVVSFCSFSVLCVLVRPGPGEVGRNRERVDQSKQRAFHTIMAIMGALLLRFFANLVSSGLNFSAELSDSVKCFISWSVIWLYLPSSLVLPLLFLHRAGKLPACKHNTVPT